MGRDNQGVPGRVATIEYDPNRSARIALIVYADGDKRYILHALGVKVGDTVVSGERVDIVPGNAMPLRNMPLGTQVHNVELRPGKEDGTDARSAGSSVQVMAKDGKYITVRLPSGETRLVQPECRATVGQVGNVEHENVRVGKAGRSRWAGRRPHVCGNSMNPVDHPLGGRGGARFRRAAPGVALGHAGQGLPDAEEEAVRQVHRVAQEEAVGGDQI